MSARAPAPIATAGLAILRCPACGAAEPVEAALAGQALMVECRGCGASWPARHGLSGRGANPRSGAALPALPIEASWPQLAAEEAGDFWAARILADDPPPPERRRAWLAALCALGGLVAIGLGAGALASREAALAAKPELAGLYAAIGLPAQPAGLAVEAVAAERRIDGDGATVKVSGRLVNLGGEARAVPPLVLLFSDDDGIVLHAAAADAPTRRLAAGRSERFVFEVAGVPRQARHVLVRAGEGP